MNHKNMRQVMQGAIVLTLASLIAKILSALYRIPLQNLVGDEGFYVYQQVYPIYGIAMTLALSGLPQFISKYVAEKKTPLEQKNALKQVYPYVFWTGIGLWLGILLFGTEIAKLMGDQQLAPLVQIVSFTFLLMPGLSIYRGNFQGRFLVEPTAVSQVVEQLIRVVVIVCSALAFRRFGWDIYQTGTAAMGGAVVGGLFALSILQYYEKKVYGERLELRYFPPLDQASRRFIHRFLIEGGLLSIYSGLLIFFQLVDSFFVKNALQYYGFSEHASKVAKGVYDRGQPLVQLGLVIATALSATFLPMLTRFLIRNEQRQFIQTAKIYLRLTTALALAASTGIALLLPYINYALFKDYAGNGTLALFLFSIALTAVIQAYQSIAQSKNRFRPSLKAAGWGVLVKLLLTAFLTSHFGTVGASLSTLAGLTMTLIALIRAETKQITIFWQERHFGRKLLLSLFWMVFVLLIYYGVIALFGSVQRRWVAFFVSVLGAGIGGSSFIFMLIKLQVFTIREWLVMPFGKKVLSFNLKKKHKK